MGTKQAFKTYARGQRVQDTNISFASGMSYSTAPLEEGFSRLLVNFDFGEDGNTLKPRRGLQTTEEGLFDYVEGADANPLKFTEKSSFDDSMSIVAGNRYVYDNKTYYQIIVGQITGYNEPLKRHIGNAWVLTCQHYKENNQTYNIIRKWVPLNDSTSTNLKQYCLFTKPSNEQASICGIQLNPSEYIKRHVGAFAFNGGYYYFTVGNDTEQAHLHYTKFDTETLAFGVNTVTAYKPYQSETQNSLYNMLLAEPYTFGNQKVPGVLRLTGFMPTKNELTVLAPQMGVRYNYKLFYTYPEEEAYCFHIEYNTGLNDVWHSIDRDETVAQKAGEAPFAFNDIQVDSAFAQFRIYAVKESIATFTDKDNSKQLDLPALAKAIVLTASFNYAGTSQASSTTNATLKRYDLSVAAGMTYWKNRLWVFGAKDRETGEVDKTILFSSLVNRPDWFPYTAGADFFDEEIIYIQPMLDDLLVFTNQNLYSLTLSEDGLSWTRKHLQTNLNLTPWDLNFIQIVKNMVFFKSGDYFYMVVPKLTAASGSGLAIAPVSKSIKYLLDNFNEVVHQVVDDLYNYSCVTQFGSRSRIEYTLKLIHYHNFLDYEDVHNCYIFECEKIDKLNKKKITKVYLNFELLYNTVSRTWRIYTTESQRARQPLFMNATGKGKYAELVKYNGNVCIQLLEYNNNSVEDLYIKQETTDERATPPLVFENWQYLDTGNQEQNTEMKKRFREYQFKINNTSSSLLNFYSGFVLDKAIRTYEMLYSTVESEDEEGTTLLVDAQPVNNIQGAPHISTLTEDLSQKYQYTKLGYWKLGVSKFPKKTAWKIRIPTSGKGYLPRTILISYNDRDYELLSCATVYRQLYSR